ncbi:hypothetical protein SAMD00019534_102730 [Acytostelium subglobosum LB1]|uniref:hypothetical protein n=1 Tax=Acytostelium subglobosum LB1 TaxID=1410327 RepID=UPI0006449640|nr:hypothetical protein SAMD00019534_102730 [Acytostelium subglobosum LB1]GAM27098.1 hypothetical protein SAMD00019534_102730 [Acytostelium subglobosum LB1]|eukprot:XP_012749978.1 hypothetical protein SAMD00019534_102730 [Acytostelium subglobosum LB1]
MIDQQQQLIEQQTQQQQQQQQQLMQQQKQQHQMQQQQPQHQQQQPQQQVQHKSLYQYQKHILQQQQLQQHQQQQQQQQQLPQLPQSQSQPQPQQQQQQLSQQQLKYQQMQLIRQQQQQLQQQHQQQQQQQQHQSQPQQQQELPSIDWRLTGNHSSLWLPEPESSFVRKTNSSPPTVQSPTQFFSASMMGAPHSGSSSPIQQMFGYQNQAQAQGQVQAQVQPQPQTQPQASPHQYHNNQHHNGSSSATSSPHQYSHQQLQQQQQQLKQVRKAPHVSELLTREIIDMDHRPVSPPLPDHHRPASPPSPTTPKHHRPISPLLPEYQRPVSPLHHHLVSPPQTPDQQLKRQQQLVQQQLLQQKRQQLLQQQEQLLQQQEQQEQLHQLHRQQQNDERFGIRSITNANPPHSPRQQQQHQHPHPYRPPQQQQQVQRQQHQPQQQQPQPQQQQKPRHQHQEQQQQQQHQQPKHVEQHQQPKNQSTKEMDQTSMDLQLPAPVTAASIAANGLNLNDLIKNYETKYKPMRKLGMSGNNPVNLMMLGGGGGSRASEALAVTGSAASSAYHATHSIGDSNESSPTTEIFITMEHFAHLDHPSYTTIPIATQMYSCPVWGCPKLFQKFKDIEVHCMQVHPASAANPLEQRGVDIVALSELSDATALNHHSAGSIPVLISGLPKSWRTSELSIDSLLQHYGTNRTMWNIVDEDGVNCQWVGDFKKFFDTTSRQRRNSCIVKMSLDLPSKWDPLPTTKTNYLSLFTHSYLFVAGSGSVISLHRQFTDLTITTIQGLMRVIMFPPNKMMDIGKYNKDFLIKENSKSSFIYFDHQLTEDDLDLISKFGGRIVFLKKEESLFVPAGWYFQTTVLDDECIFVHGQCLNQNNLEFFLQNLRRRSFGDSLTIEDLIKNIITDYMARASGLCVQRRPKVSGVSGLLGSSAAAVATRQWNNFQCPLDKMSIFQQVTIIMRECFTLISAYYLVTQSMRVEDKIKLEQHQLVEGLKKSTNELNYSLLSLSSSGRMSG